MKKIDDVVECFTCKKGKVMSDCLPVNSWQTYQKLYECKKCRGLKDSIGFRIKTNNVIPTDDKP
jgi:hypothetical protein